MKRMYVTLGALILIVGCAVTYLINKFVSYDVEVVESTDPVPQRAPRTRFNIPHNLHSAPDVTAQIAVNDQLAESQKTQVQKFLQLREEMHRRMMDKVLRGIGPDEDLFADMDQSFEDAFSDSLTGRAVSPNIQTEWSESSTGRTLTITPQNKDQPLDINIEKGMVSIKGKVESKSPQGTSISEFAQSLSIPSDCDPEKVKMDHKDGKIVMVFPFFKPLKEIRKPVGPSENDVQI